MLSGEPLRINFFPSSLLSIGDLLAFCKEVSATPAETCSNHHQQQHQQGSPEQFTVMSAEGLSVCGSMPPRPSAHARMMLSSSMGQRQQQQQLHQEQQQQQQHATPARAIAARSQAPPSIEEQMALAEGLTSRIPQR
jgi:hypothetical protein